MSDQGNISDCAGPCPASPQLQLYQTIIFATPVLFAFLLLVLFCMLYIRRRRNAVISPEARLQFISRGFSPSPVPDHGLSKSFRQRLPTVPFDEKFASVNEDHQCAVCLCDYEMQEKLQQLPACKHAFHVLCIDEWLAKNTTCPICRASLLQGVDRNACVGVPSFRAEDNRRWEERVVNEVQDGLSHARVVNEVQDGLSHARGDLSNEVGVSIGVVPSSGVVPPRFSTDHAINIERS